MFARVRSIKRSWRRRLLKKYYFEGFVKAAGLPGSMHPLQYFMSHRALQHAHRRGVGEELRQHQSMV